MPFSPIPDNQIVNKTPHGAEEVHGPMNQITITLPAIDETVIANLDTLTIQASATEIEALKAMREKYAVLARQNGLSASLTTA